jgi:hypothetical protein
VLRRPRVLRKDHDLGYLHPTLLKGPYLAEAFELDDCFARRCWSPRPRRSLARVAASILGPCPLRPCRRSSFSPGVVSGFHP